MGLAVELIEPLQTIQRYLTFRLRHRLVDVLKAQFVVDESNAFRFDDERVPLECLPTR